MGEGEKEERKGGSLAPLLEETHPLTLAIGAPEIAAAAGAVAAVLRPVIAVAPASYASPLLCRSHQILQSIVCIIRGVATLEIAYVFTVVEVRTGEASVGQDDQQKGQPQ